MTCYYRVEGNQITFTCSLGALLILLLILFANDLYIISIIGVIGYFILFIALIGLYFIPWMLFSPIHWSKRWFLRVTKEGLLDNAFGYRHFYPWTSIRSHELKQVRKPASDRYIHELILKVDSRNISIPLHKYGIDTESEASNFMSQLEQYFHHG
ncbi:MAG: hypothetical protein ACFFCP_01060 [Promethearchaeota archaeon]